MARPALLSWMRRLFLTLVYSVLFGWALLLSAALHADAPPVRRAVTALVGKTLEGALVGTIKIGELQEFSTRFIVFSELSLLDERGTQVLKLEQVRVQSDLSTWTRELLWGRGDIRLLIPHLRTERATVLIATDSTTAETTIERALTPRQTSDVSSGRALRVWFPVIELGQGTVDLHLHGATPTQGRVQKLQGNVQINPEGVTIDISQFSVDVRTETGLEGSATGEVRLDDQGTLACRVNGDILGVEYVANAKLKGDRLLGVLHIPRVGPDLAQRFLGTWPDGETADMQLRVYGDLPNLKVDGKAHLGAASLALLGNISVKTPLSAQLGLTLQHLNLEDLKPTWPETSLSLSSTLDIAPTGEDQRYTLRLTGHTEATKIGETSVPRAIFDLESQYPKLTGEVRVEEPGLPLRARLDGDLTDTLSLDWKVESFALGAWQRVQHGARAQVSAQGTGTLRDGTLTTTSSVSFTDLKRDAVEVRHGALHLKSTGPLNQLQQWELAGNGTFRDVHAGGVALERVRVDFSGPLGSLKTKLTVADHAERTLSVQATVTAWPELKVRHAKLEARAGTLAARGRISHLDVARGEVHVPELDIQGARNHLTGAFRFQGRVLETSVHGDQVDLSEVSTALGLVPALEGIGSVQLDAQLAPSLTRARLSAKLQDVKVGDNVVAEALLETSLDGTKLTASANARGSFGEANAEADLHIEADSSGIPIWQTTTGQAKLRMAEQSLSIYSGLFEEVLGARTAGTGSLEITATRGDTAALPVVFFSANSADLTLSGSNAFSGEQVQDGPFGVSLSGVLDPNEETIRGAASVLFNGYPLVTGTGGINAPWNALLANPVDIPRLIRDAPLTGSFQVPQRPLSGLPGLIAPPATEGALELRTSIGGTVAEPSLFLVGSLQQLTWQQRTEPVDVELHGGFASQSGELSLNARVRARGAELAGAQVEGKYKSTPSGERAWVGTGAMRLSGVPVSLLNPVTGGRWGGTLVGTARFAKAVQQQSVNAQFIVGDLSIDGSPLGRATLDVRATGRDAEASFLLSRQNQNLNVNLDLHTETAFPKVDAMKLEVDSDGIDAALLSPILSGIANRLSGKLEAKLAVVLARNARGKMEAGLTGTARLRDGKLFLVPLGVELNGVRFDLAAERVQSRSQVQLQALGAKTRGGTGTVDGRLALVLENLALDRGTGTFQLRELPLAYEGVTRGKMTGTVTANLARRPEYMLLALRLPNVALTLPRQTARDLVDVEAHPEIIVVQHEASTLPSDAPSTPWRVTLDLADGVRVGGVEADVRVTGTPELQLTDTLSSKGQVILTRGGRIPVFGKVFLVEQGVIDLNPEELGNPNLDVTLSWQAPNGTRVLVDVDGPYKGDITPRLSSSPALPEEEILALVLGGGAQGSSGAVAVGGGVAAQGLSELTGQSFSNVQVRVDSQEESSPNYAAAIRIGDNLWFEGSYQQHRASDPANAGDIVTGTVDYQINRRWSLRTELGLGGGAVDLRWQYTY